MVGGLTNGFDHGPEIVVQKVRFLQSILFFRLSHFANLRLEQSSHLQRTFELNRTRSPPQTVVIVIQVIRSNNTLSIFGATAADTATYT